jgi:hypothetical protein
MSIKIELVYQTLRGAHEARANIALEQYKGGGWRDRESVYTTVRDDSQGSHSSRIKWGEGGEVDTGPRDGLRGHPFN